MSNKETRCGIYAITTPNGTKYIGSSNKIERRWHEHRSNLRTGKHHSTRLQDAWKKHGVGLEFSVLQECAVEELNRLEQDWIDKLSPALNTSVFVKNVWLNPDTKEKFRVIHSSPEWKKARAEIAANASSRWIPVDCSDGRSFINMAAAARAFGVKNSGIFHLVATQRAGKLGVRFKMANEAWRDVVDWKEQRVLTMRASGNDKRSPESKAKMSASAKARCSA